MATHAAIYMLLLARLATGAASYLELVHSTLGDRWRLVVRPTCSNCRALTRPACLHRLSSPCVLQ
jgi:hypothetical protein